ncbi:ABC transporter permease [Conyzicola nivalis]|uniref:Sugar ABC transporter permease n=1 Tax=Conyzicola nivalis TaxID=1477021 RepID=A0A916WM86_9MICO|nr:ABC transporter permease [Conyzicola nivalis]GGB11213.1 sugar ABC transporter permease [Conyzicola nivalis]
MSHQTAAPEEQQASSNRASATLRRFLGSAAGRNIGLVIALLLLIVVGAVTSGDRFTSISNVLTIVRLASVTGVLAIGMTFVIISGGIDLSVGSVLGLSSVVATLAAVQASAASFWPLMIIVALAVGLAAGVINGIIIAYGNVVAFMATLAMLIAARGFAEILSNRTTQTVKVRGFLEFSDGNFLGVPTLVWIFILVSAAGWILLNRTTFGRRTVAIGGNREAARLAGINVKRHIVYLYALSGLTAGIAGIMLTGRTTSGTSTHGTLYELDAIAAVVVGGTLLAGGRGTIVGTVLGILIFNVLTNIFTQNNLNTSVQAITKGAIIVIAVLIQQRFANRGVRKS